ncbi:serine hydrolase [Pseudohongiella nitratireducens]|uniref:serine hydrolase n=1 Tax=Pseudohongiella nitratireducens TaxID=1768907 RepID=UPI0009EF1C5D|nr:serine hydrolase domain-containing protein [Pseudohongiella nitratireducens]
MTITHRYTNAGYSLLAAILEIASGEQWQEFIDSRLLSGSLNNIYFYTERDDIKDSLAYGYALRQGQDSVSEGRETFEWGTIGAAGVYARAKDLVYLVDELLRQSPVPEQQREKMLDPTEEESYGWHVDTDSMGRNRVHKGGDSLEYTSQILYYPDSDITITWMVNNNRNRWRTILRDGLVAWVYDERIPEH